MTTAVLLHGAWGAPSDWDDVVAAHHPGPTHRPDLVDISVGTEIVEVSEVWNQTVAGLARGLPAGGLVIAGYSLGARLALGLALHPDVKPRLEGLLLVAGTAGIEGDGARAARAVIDDERAAWQARDPAAFLEAFWGLDLFAGLRSHPRRGALLAQRIERASASPDRLAWLMRGLSVGRMPSLWGALPQIQAPAVIVSGALDGAYVEAGERLSTSLARARHVVVKDAGHALLVEAPSAVGGALASLVAELP